MLCKQGCQLSEKYKNAVLNGLRALGKKNMALILHGVSFPSELSENTGFGTYNSYGGKRVIDFSSGMFSAIQLGPAGKTKLSDASPYTGTIFSENPLFIDLKELTTKEWEKLLSEETYDSIVKNCPHNYDEDKKNKAAYIYACEKTELALSEAYNNFKGNFFSKHKKPFEQFKKDSAFWLDNDALYEAFSIENGSDYYPHWENEFDKTIFKQTDKKAVEARLKEIAKKYSDVIEIYKFTQYVAAYQSEKTRRYAKIKGIKMIADRQVAFSDRDCWAYQTLFLDGWCLGCPPDYFSEDGQAWGFPVLDPEKLFDKNGNLGEAGIVLKKLYIKMFKENPGGVRIDHTVGLIDPWVYKAGKLPKIEQGAGRLYSSPQHEFLKKYSIATMDDVNEEYKPDEEKWIKQLSDKQIEMYGRMLEKIVIAAAEETKLDKNAIVAEDLGTLTYPVVKVMEKYGLQGMKLVQFVVAEEPDHPYRCKNTTPNSWSMVGTHDNEPILMWAQSMIGKTELKPHVDNLMEDLFCGNFDNEDEIQHKLYNDADFLAFAKLVEIFACKSENIQIFFTDFFGINKVYNRPGTSGDTNWSLRLPANFEELYQENLQNKTALNLPLVLSYAIRARGKDFVKKNQKLLDELGELI